MRIFENDSKTNFVDIHDVYVGFDSWQSCCESFGFFFTTDKQPSNKLEPSNLDYMVFDTSFFEEKDRGEHGWTYDNEAIFRLVDARFTREATDQSRRELERELAATGGTREVYLHLYNHHNGYYSHGFTMTVGGNVILEGAL